MKTSEYASYDAVGLAELIANGEVTQQEVVDTAITAIEELNPQLNAIIHESFDRARKEAAAKLPDGPFRGVPFLLKDIAAGNRAGDPNHWGTRFLKDIDHRATTTSHLVEKFEGAGLVVLGRTNVPELGAWSTTESDAYGPCRSPWNTEHSTGGSSGGAAAAVAAGLVPIAHGSDGGGSIRNPASQCGLVGLKPTRARISLGPDFGEAWAGMGFEFALSRTVRDTAALLDCVHGMMPGDPYGAVLPERPYLEEVKCEPGRLRVGILSHLATGDVHPECVAAAEGAGRLLESLGHDVDESYPEDIAGSELLRHIMSIIAPSQARAIENFGNMIGRELGPEDMDCDNWEVTRRGREVPATKYLAAVEANQQFQRRVAAWWEQDHDLLITPTIPRLSPLIGEITPDPDNLLDAFARSGAISPFILPFNVTGQPAISLPLHVSESGLPVGVQLVAAFGREDLLIRVASQLEDAVGWGARKPQVHASNI